MIVERFSVEQLEITGQPPFENMGEAVDVEFRYVYTPPGGGKRERGTGLLLDPDYPDEVEILSVTIVDPNTNESLTMHTIDKIFGAGTVDQYQQLILDTLYRN